MEKTKYFLKIILIIIFQKHFKEKYTQVLFDNFMCRIHHTLYGMQNTESTYTY